MKINLTVTGVHEDIGEQATMKFDGITRDDVSRQVIFELPRKEGLELKAVYEGLVAAGSGDLVASVDVRQIVRDLTFESAAEDAVAKARGQHILNTRIADEDQHILDQMHTTAIKVAEHEHAQTPLGRPQDDSIMFQIAQDRRGAEAELNKLITARVNKLSAQHKQTL